MYIGCFSDLCSQTEYKDLSTILGENLYSTYIQYTILKLKFSFRNFFSKCQQILLFLRICPHLLKKSLIRNLIFWAVVKCGTEKLAIPVNSALCLISNRHRGAKLKDKLQSIRGAIAFWCRNLILNSSSWWVRMSF